MQRLVFCACCRPEWSYTEPGKYYQVKITSIESQLYGAFVVFADRQVQVCITPNSGWDSCNAANSTKMVQPVRTKVWSGSSASQADL